VLADPARGIDEIDCVIVVLVDPGGDRKDVRVEDNVLGREVELASSAYARAQMSILRW
jgi:hypothetical protein